MGNHILKYTDAFSNIPTAQLPLILDDNGFNAKSQSRQAAQKTLRSLRLSVNTNLVTEAVMDENALSIVLRAFSARDKI